MNSERIIADYNAQPDWVTIGGKHIYFRSKLEQRWAHYLEFLKCVGAITEWGYETQKFEFEGIRSGVVFYTPDFVIVEGQEYHWQELKGYLHQKDVTKFRRMQKYYPEERIVLVMQSITKKNKLKVQNASRYVERIIEGGKILRKCGL